MLYAEYESYHFLSISLSAYIHKAKSHDRIIVICGGEKMKCHCIHWPQTKCQKPITSMRMSFTLIEIIRWENVNQKEECLEVVMILMYIYLQKVIWAYKLFFSNNILSIHFITTTVLYCFPVVAVYRFNSVMWYKNWWTYNVHARILLCKCYLKNVKFILS